MKLQTLLIVVLSFVVFAAAGYAGPIGYTLDITTFYQFGAPPGTLGAFAPSPDTSFFTVTNNGTTTFTGTISDVAMSQFSGDFSQSFSGLTLAPGASVTVITSPESSNEGGFNGPFGSAQPGIAIDLVGLINGSEAVNLSVNDSNIHSGVVNGSGLTDAYVLQGGNPFGADNGDGIEVTQAPGHFEFFEAGGSTSVPEPHTLVLLGTALVALAAGRKLTRKIS